MPSFDIVSKVDTHELTNAVDQANRVISTRFDFKGIDAKVAVQDDSHVQLKAEAEFQLQQILDIFQQTLIKRNIDIACLDPQDVTLSGKHALQMVHIKQGIDAQLGKSINKRIKDAKLKVQSSIQGDQVRVTGKKRDDLQQVIAMLKSAEDIDLPLQFSNFRD